MNLSRSWQPIVDIFQNRLAKWKAKSLSHGGRITLLKSVLNALPIYYFSLFKAPLGVIKSLEKIRREFFWSHNDDHSRMKWVAWKKLTAPKNFGGLGLGSLRLFNMALLAKWWWRYKVEIHSLWRKIIYAIHHTSRTTSFIPLRSSISSPWKQIAKLGSDFLEFGLPLHQALVASPGRCSEVRFWLDCWLSDVALCEAFPRLFELEKVKHALLKDRLLLLDRSPGLRPAWSRNPSLGPEMDELQSLRNRVLSCEFGVAGDLWKWRWNSSGCFSVCSLRIKLESLYFQDTGASLDWNRWVPIKVNFFAWRILNNGVPTLSAMARRGIRLTDLSCPFCGEYEESIIHLLGTCRFASLVWDFIATWCRLSPIYFMEISDLTRPPQNYRGSKTWVKVIHLIFLTTIWVLWKHRNAVVFYNAQPSVDCIIGEIKSMGFLWIRSRSKLINLSWPNWISFSLPSI